MSLVGSSQESIGSGPQVAPDLSPKLAQPLLCYFSSVGLQHCPGSRHATLVELVDVDGVGVPLHVDECDLGSLDAQVTGAADARHEVVHARAEPERVSAHCLGLDYVSLAVRPTRWVGSDVRIGDGN